MHLLPIGLWKLLLLTGGTEMKIQSSLLILVLVLVGCASKEQVKQVLTDNPELVFAAIEKNPQKYMEILTKAANEYRKTAALRARDEEKEKREAEFKNPRTPLIAEDRPVRGAKAAPITLVEYSDFQCPYCKRGYQVVEELRKKYADKIKFVFKHSPLPFHPMAMPAAKYFEAIALQSPSKAFAFHDEVFKNQNLLESQKIAFLDRSAKRAGADLERLKKDLESDVVKHRIEADMAEARQFGINGTPGFVVAGITLMGAQPASEFEEVIERRLKEAAPRPVASEAEPKAAATP